MEAIEKKKYFRNTQARSLVSGKSWILGLIVSDITNPFFPEVVKGFEEKALVDGYDVVVTSTSYDSERMAVCVRRLLERKVDGVAVMTSEMDEHLVDQLAYRDVPLVFLDAGVPRSGVTNIVVDYSLGITEAVGHLVELGHRRIGFVSGPMTLKSARIRRAAFIEALTLHGLRDECIVEGDHKVEGGLDAMKRLLVCPNRPTAVLASNDLTAIGMMRAVRQVGMSVPDDISIIGFDDISLAEFTDPALTTIRLPRRELAELAFQSIVNDINLDEYREYQVQTHLVVRETTCRFSD